MAEEACLNCGAKAADTYDLLVRSTEHSEVPLCEECHDAIQEEMREEQS